MIVREAWKSDLQELLNIYLFLHEERVPELTGRVQSVWSQMLEDCNHHMIVAEEEGRMVASCICAIVPNLTRNCRPYALIENVVTNVQFRNRGYATACLKYAKSIAESEHCYKMMLLTGSKDEKTLRFYRRAGFNSEDKTAFIRWLP